MAAQEDWWNTRPQERTRIVRGVADLLDEHADEVRELANDTESGLAGSVHSADVGRARDVADRIGVGMMHVNDPPVNAGAHTPFGGMKASGIGRYNGDWIIREFTKGKWPSIQRHDRGYLF